MDITIQNDLNNTAFLSLLASFKLCFLPLFSFVSFSAFSKVDINAVASVNSVYQDVKRNDEDTISLTTVILEPSLNIGYRSKTFQGLWQGSYTHLERDSQDTGLNQDYGEYSYSALWKPYNDVISFRATGALHYQNTNTANFLVSDFLINADDLAKTRSNRFSSTLNVDKGNWIRANGTASYSDTASERTENNENALNNDNFKLIGNLLSGKKMRRITWSLAGTFQSTQQNAVNEGRFKSRTGNGNVNIRVFKTWAIRFNGQHEANQISDRRDTSSLVREFNSVGTGLVYQQNKDRYIALTLNKSDSDREEDDNNTFVGVDVNWALSPRTNVSAGYGRRFYGEAINARINYNTKYLRAALTYSEDVTNTSRLIADTENLGVFVCPTTSISIADCYQPNSLDYTPEVDEQIVQFSSQNVEFDDNIILRKSANFQSGYRFSRVTLAVSSQYSLDDYLDATRLRRTYSIGLNLAYNIGNYTNLTSSVSYGNVADKVNLNNDTVKSDNWNTSLGVTRELGQHLVAKFDIVYLRQKQNGSTTSNIDNNFSDRRVSASISYTYD